MRAVRRAILQRRIESVRSGERDALRPYEPCDAARTIDWRASARLGRTFVREARAAPLSWAAIVDGSGSMRVPEGRTPIAQAREAACIWRGCAAAGDDWNGDEQPDADFQVEEALHAALLRLPFHCALLCVSDFHDMRTACRPLLEVCAARFDCTALLVRDPWPRRLPPHGFFRAVDAETNVVRIIHTEQKVRDRYTAAVQQRERAVMQMLAATGWRAAYLETGEAAASLRRAFDL